MSEAKKNTDREIWRELLHDYYSDSIFVTENGLIGINCAGSVIVLPVRQWHRLAKIKETGAQPNNSVSMPCKIKYCTECGKNILHEHA